MTRRFCLAFALWTLAAAAAEGDVAIVVRPEVPVEDLTMAEVRKLFMGDRQYWNSSMRVTLLVRAPVAREREVILKKLYQMTEAQYRQYWISKVFRASAATGPKIVYTTEMAVELVSAIPGAVAFLEADKVPKGLKVVTVDGKKPTDKGYPLR